MLKAKQSILINGSSYIKINNEEHFIANMSARIDDNDINIVKTICNKELFNVYKEDVQNDFSDFEKYVYSMVNKE